MVPRRITEDYWIVLEISHKAILENVRKRYRRKAIALYPNLNSNDRGATASVQPVRLTLPTFDSISISLGSY